MNTETKENGTTDLHRKRNRDRFLVILMGLVGYGLILIGIVIFPQKGEFLIGEILVVDEA